MAFFDKIRAAIDFLSIRGRKNATHGLLCETRQAAARAEAQDFGNDFRSFGRRIHYLRLILLPLKSRLYRRAAGSKGDEGSTN